MQVRANKTTSISKVFAPTTTNRDFRLIVSLYLQSSSILKVKAYYENELPFYQEQKSFMIKHSAKYLHRFPDVPVTNLSKSRIVLEVDLFNTQETHLQNFITTIQIG